MPNIPTIREACNNDKKRLGRLSAELFKDDAYASVDLVDNFADLVAEQWWQLNLAAWLVFVAEVDGVVVGYIKGRLAPAMPLYTYKRVGFVEEFFVESTRRGHGIGRALFAAFEDAIRGDTDRILLHTGVGGAAVKFYEKHGFKPVAYRMAKLMRDGNL